MNRATRFSGFVRLEGRVYRLMGYTGRGSWNRYSRSFDAAVRYDRATLIGWALAQVSFVAFVYFLTREEKRTLIPVEGEPLVRTRDGGFEIGFKVAP